MEDEDQNLQNWDVTRKCSYFMALYGGLNQHVGLSLSSTISEHVNLAIKLGMDMGFTRAQDRDSSTNIMGSDTNIEIFLQQEWVCNEWKFRPVLLRR